MVSKTVLDNGLRIITESLSHSRLTSVGIWVDVGSRDEHDLNNGCAHFIEHMLFKGTPSRSARQIARELDVLGGTGNAFTSRENTCYYATVLDSHLPQLVDLLADIFLNSRFPVREIERERQVIQQEISMVEDTPDDHIHDLFAKLLWNNHPLGRTVLGTREVVAAMDAKKLRDHLRQFYTPDRVLIAAAGNLDHEDFVGLWKDKAFAALRPASTSHLSRQVPTGRQAQRAVYSKPLEQVHMLLGTYGESLVTDDRYSYLIMNVLLGGNMSSRLFQEIREKRGLAYSIYSYITAYIDSGYLGIYLGIDPQSVNEALALVLKEIDRLRRNPVAVGELIGAKEFITAGLFLAAENMESIMTRIAKNELCFGRDLPMEEIVTAIAGVSAVDVQAMAEKTFGSNQLTLGALGPLAPEEIDWALLANLR
jgi:predicted Zn-dependent peptidase